MAKRIRNRILGAAIGLVLGWTAFGAWQAASYATTPADDGSHARQTDGEAAAADVQAARQLVPSADGPPAAPAWYVYAMGGAAALFGAAIIVGLIARAHKLEDPNLAAAAADKAEGH